MKRKESDLYLPVKRFLESQDYTVKGEVQDCDVVALRGESVEVLLDPGEYSPRKSQRRQERLLGEFTKRVGDPTLGGSSTKQGRVTAYRQRAVTLAHWLLQQGPTKASHIARTLDEPKAREIMYRDVYGWFEKVSVGIYSLSPRGQREIHHWLATTDTADSKPSQGHINTE